MKNPNIFFCRFSCTGAPSKRESFAKKVRRDENFILNHFLRWCLSQIHILKNRTDNRTNYQCTCFKNFQIMENTTNSFVRFFKISICDKHYLCQLVYNETLTRILQKSKESEVQFSSKLIYAGSS